jgi:HEPN domain-containing protein
MSPAEDAALLLGIVRRHLRTLQLGIEAEIPEEDWGFLAQQALEKILKAWIVLADRRPPRRHDLSELALQAGIDLAPELLELQVFAVEARYEEGSFQLPGSREALLRKIEALMELCELDLRGQASEGDH